MKKILALILTLALTLTALPLFSAAEQKDDPLARYVNTSNGGKLNVRSAPQTHTDNVITQLENGTRVVIIEYLENNAWVKVEFPLKGKVSVGYVQNRYLSTTKPAVTPVKPTAKPSASNNENTAETLNFKKLKHVEEPFYMTVKPSTPGGYVNLRWGPSKSVSVMTKLYADAQVIVIAKDATWAQVYDPETGYVGFMMLAFLK